MTQVKLIDIKTMEIKVINRERKFAAAMNNQFTGTYHEILETYETKEEIRKRRLKEILN